jgi:hypothetical protein
VPSVSPKRVIATARYLSPLPALVSGDLLIARRDLQVEDASVLSEPQLLQPRERGTEETPGNFHGLRPDPPGQVVLRVLGYPSSSLAPAIVARVSPSYPHSRPFRLRLAGRAPLILADVR